MHERESEGETGKWGL